MFQAYVSVGSGSSQPLHIKDSCTFYPNLYSKTIKQAVSDYGFSENNTSVSTDIQYKGTTYKKGHFLVSKNDETVEFGELLIILIKNDAEVYFVMIYIKLIIILSIICTLRKKDCAMLQCLEISDLVDFYPLTSYIC